MILEKIPELIMNDFDKDSLVYNDDSSLYYGSKVSNEIIKDIKYKEIQVYGGYYIFTTGKNSPTIFLLCRGKRSGKVKLKIENFKPYCYISKKNGEYKTYLGDPCEKIVFESCHPGRVKVFRDVRQRKGYPLPYEADILFVRRFLCDIYDIFKPLEPIKPEVAILDIETNHPINNDIISYSINDMKNDIIYDSKFNSNDLVMTIDILEHLKKYDWVTGWNVEFDINILEESLAKIQQVLDYIKDNTTYSPVELVARYSTDIRYQGKIQFLIDSLLDYGYLKLDNYGKLILKDGFDGTIGPVSNHTSHIDLLKVSKKMYGQEIRGNWTLGNVGHRLCGINKFSIGNKHIKDLSEDELLEYNVIDTIIPEIVDNFLGGLEAHLMLAWSLQGMINDMEITAIINDIALIRAYHKSGIVLPSRNYIKKNDNDSNKEPKYKAAEPDAKQGFYEGIIATDLTHAYPFAVISKNISPETKDLLGENIVNYKDKNGEQREVRFNNNNSIFIDTLKDIMIERSKAKEKMKSLDKGSQEWKKYKYIDFALKTQAAAFSHGIFGWSISRMVDYEVADAITGVVRNLLDKIKESCDFLNRDWIYSHTDSVYINAPKEEKDKILEFLNNKIEEYCKGYLVQPNLDFKNYYRVGYIHSKARNVLVPEDGNINDPDTWDITGMDFMRSETPEAISEIEIRLIELIFEKVDRNRLVLELREMIKNLLSIDTTLLGTAKPLKKPISCYGKIKKDGSIGGIPYHIKALQRATAEYGFTVNVGEKFMILPIITGETRGKRVIKRKVVFVAYNPEYGLPSNYRIDFITYLRSNLWGKICSMFVCEPKELEKEVMNEDVRMCLLSEMI